MHKSDDEDHFKIPFVRFPVNCPHKFPAGAEGDQFQFG